MLFLYVLGMLSMRVKAFWVLAVVCAVLCFATSLLFDIEAGRAGMSAVSCFVMGLAWFWMLTKASDTIFMWFLIFLPGPFAMSLGIAVIDVAMFGPIRLPMS